MVNNFIHTLEWDSDFFNLKIGTIEVSSKSDENSITTTEDFDLIYAKFEQNFDFEIVGFDKKFEEQKVIFGKFLEPFQIQENKNTSSFKASDTEKYNLDLYQLAFESGKFSRFKLDERFTQKQFEDLYKKWVDNSVSRVFADDVLVYQIEDKIVGFVTFKVHSDFATIGLIATHPEFQGQGIGKQLIKEVEQKLINTNCFELRIPTQESNLQACNFYSKLGYQIIESTTIKHYWKI